MFQLPSMDILKLQAWNGIFWQTDTTGKFIWNPHWNHGGFCWCCGFSHLRPVTEKSHGTFPWFSAVFVQVAEQNCCPKVSSNPLPTSSSPSWLKWAPFGLWVWETEACLMFFNVNNHKHFFDKVSLKSSTCVYNTFEKETYITIYTYIYIHLYYSF